MAVSVIAGLQAGGVGSKRSMSMHKARKIVDTLCDEHILQLVWQYVRRGAIMGMLAMALVVPAKPAFVI